MKSALRNTTVKRIPAKLKASPPRQASDNALRAVGVLSRGLSARSEALRKRAHALIPGGSHTYSKGDDQFPANAPALIARARGCWCWDTDGRKWLDYGMGLRAVILGHGYGPILSAVRRELRTGSNFTRPSPIEADLAEQMRELFPSAEMSKFAKNGSDVTSAATKLARAYTGRDLIAACSANPFYSFDDWWIGKTATDSGIPKAISELTLMWIYNDLQSLKRLFNAHPGQIACVILEPVAMEPPKPGFLQGVVDMAHANGAIVVFDEMISGFRYHLKGAQGLYGVTPDMATFGKALANGFSVSALCGKAEIMQTGGLHHDRERVFLLSATHGAETHALAAAIASIDVMRKNDVAGHVARLGRRLKAGLNSAAKNAGLAGIVESVGYDQSPVVVCRDGDRKVSMPFRTLWLQEMIERGILIPYIAVSWSHTDREIDRTIEAAAGAFSVYANALDQGIERFLRGPVVKPVFRRYNDQ